MTSIQQWSDTFKLVLSLWPKWKPTAAQAEEFTERFGTKNQSWVRQCFRDHYALDDSPFAPKSQKVLERFAAIAEAGEGGATGGFLGWRAAWTKNIEGQDYQISSAQRFSTKGDALSFADRMGRLPFAFLVGAPNDDGSFVPQEEFDEVMREREEVVQDLMAMDPARLRRAIREAVALIGCKDVTNEPDIRKWPVPTRGVVHAADERLQSGVQSVRGKQRSAKA